MSGQSSSSPDMVEQRKAQEEDEEEEEEEEDYLTMSVPDPGQTKRLGSLTHQEKQRIKERKLQEERARKEKERKRAHVSLFQQEETKQSRAFQMMKKMGYSEGSTLGSSDKATSTSQGRLAEPIVMDLKLGRGGIGYDSAVKRKAAEELESARKKGLNERDDYASFQRDQFQNKRLESRLRAAQHMCEVLDEEKRESEYNAQSGDKSSFPDIDALPLQCINVFWRRLVIESRERKLEQIRKREALESLSHIRSSAAQPDLQEQEQEEPLESDDHNTVLKSRMRGQEKKEAAAAGTASKFEQDDDMESDQELEQFEALPVEERLDKVLNHLRDTYNYCFWCSCRYTDVQDLNNSCPGLTESDHD